MDATVRSGFDFEIWHALQKQTVTASTEWRTIKTDTILDLSIMK